jgi:rSAM/selenodomain-associated transferase 1
MERSSARDPRPSAALIVMAKSPLAGRVKTRLCPPCTAEQAARLAEAALIDTLEAVAAAPARRRVLVLEGQPGDWPLDAFEVMPQRGGGLDERLAAAFEDVGGPAFAVGMDTPQLGTDVLSDALAALASPGVDAVIGPCVDGGYWGVGLKRARGDAFVGVPMSAPETYAAQVGRFAELDLVTRELELLRDVDDFADARAVAAEIPGSGFAATLAAMS